MAKSVGETIEGPPDPQQVGGLPMPPPEVQKDPRFKQIGEALKKPENMMTAIVLMGSLLQPRQQGQSGLAAFAQRGIGALAFRGELEGLNKKDKMAEAEAASVQGARKAQEAYQQGQLEHGKEQIGVQREQVAATQANTAANRELAAAQIASQQGMNVLDNETQLEIARLRRDADLRMANIEAGLQAQKDNPFGISDKDIFETYKIYGEAAANGIELPAPPQMLQMAMRNKLMTRPDVQKGVGYRTFKGPDGRVYVDVNPEYRSMFGIPGEAGPAPAPAPAAPGTAVAPSAQTPPSYSVSRPAAPAIGLPNPLLGQSVGTGSHSAPGQNPLPLQQYLYPGTR